MRIQPPPPVSKDFAKGALTTNNDVYKGES